MMNRRRIVLIGTMVTVTACLLAAWLASPAHAAAQGPQTCTVPKALGEPRFSINTDYVGYVNGEGTLSVVHPTTCKVLRTLVRSGS